MKYINADKFRKAIEDKGLDCSFALKMERLDTLALIDSLQQEQPVERLEEKEVDLEKEMRRAFQTIPGTSKLLFNDFEMIARHFYELGQQSRPKTSDNSVEDLDNLLEEEIENYFNGWSDADEYGQAVMDESRGFLCAGVDDCKDIARHFAEWGAEHLK